MDDARNRIREFIAVEIMLQNDPSVVTPATRLLGGVMDSLGLMQLVSFLQSEFGVTFEEPEMNPENFRTVEDVERLVGEKVAARRTS